MLLEAGYGIFGKRLKPSIPILVDAMKRHYHLELEPVVDARLLQISTATNDHLLADARAHIDRKRRIAYFGTA